MRVIFMWVAKNTAQPTLEEVEGDAEEVLRAAETDDNQRDRHHVHAALGALQAAPVGARDDWEQAEKFEKQEFYLGVLYSVV